MIKPWLVRRAAEHQLANLGKLLAREPVSVTPLAGMTLDDDDVRIARNQLENRAAWYDGELTAKYETEFARWNGSRHAFAFMGGRVALSACIEALGLSAGDEVILPAYTCVVVPNALRFAGVQPVYCDIELDTFGLDAARAEQAITSRTRALLLQHLYGLVCRDYEALLSLAKRHNLAVIEDCAHATGAELGGVKVGNRGDVAIYSSEQSKVFSTIQGGVAVTNDDRLAERLRAFRDRAPYPPQRLVEKICMNVPLLYYRLKHPQRSWRGDLASLWYGEAELSSTSAEEIRGERPAGYGARMPDAIAALGSNQLRKIDRYNALRRATAKRWDAWCETAGYRPATVIAGSTPVFLRYPVLAEPERKADVSWAKRELRAEIGVWFQGSLHPIEGTVPGCPRAAEAVDRCINLPTLLPASA